MITGDGEVMDYNSILNELKDVDDWTEAVEWFKEKNGVVVIAREEISKPFFSRCKRGAVGVGIPCTYHGRYFGWFAILPGTLESVVGLVDTHELLITNVEPRGLDHLTKLNHGSFGPERLLAEAHMESSDLARRCSSTNHEVPGNCWGETWQCEACSQWFCSNEGATSDFHLCDNCWFDLMESV
jgi:hypothetical protein